MTLNEVKNRIRGRLDDIKDLREESPWQYDGEADGLEWVLDMLGSLCEPENAEDYNET